MSNEQAILIEIKEQLVSMNNKLEDVKNILSNDRAMLWKVLAITIMGAFALIGIKLVFP